MRPAAKYCNRHNVSPRLDLKFTLGVLRRLWKTHHNPELLFANRHGGLQGARNAWDVRPLFGSPFVVVGEEEPGKLLR